MGPSDPPKSIIKTKVLRVLKKVLRAGRLAILACILSAREGIEGPRNQESEGRRPSDPYFLGLEVWSSCPQWVGASLSFVFGYVPGHFVWVRWHGILCLGFIGKGSSFGNVPEHYLSVRWRGRR